MKIYYVYMVLCNDGSYYTGVTNNLQRRFMEHVYGHDKTAYTFTRRPLTLAWCQEFHNIDEAILSEKKIQGWSRAKKAALIAGDWETIRALSRAHASTGSA